jgi:PEP-CTERM motif
MKSTRNISNRDCVVRAAGVAAAAILAAQSNLALAGSTGTEFTLSTAGSTALKNWFAKTQTFTFVEPGHQLNIAGTNYPSSLSYWNTNTQFQVAPQTYVSPDGSTTEAQAVRVEYHESGSVEGILELINDQVGQVPYVTNNIDRNPDSGNAVWVNYNQFGTSGTSGGAAWDPTNGGSTHGQTLGNFYGKGNVWSTGSPLSSPTFTSNPPQQVAANSATATTNGGTGQDAVVLALSDAVPKQVFQSTGGTTASNPWEANPNNANYGTGNSHLPQANLGIAGGAATYQSPKLLNYPMNSQFGTNPSDAWHTAGLGNLTSQTAAYTATLFVANPGTGLQELNRTDAQWLQLTSRLANGAGFNMTTRDVNSGTRNVAALNTGIDPTWATGKNDDGNGNGAQGVTGELAIGPLLRFSNKTAGGAQLRPTVQVARMAIGTLSINDAHSNASSTNDSPLRALLYADQTPPTTGDISSAYSAAVQASADSISQGTYAITQQEQFVTANAVNPSTDSYTGTILGDDSNGTVANLINNTLNSEVNEQALTSASNPADGLIANGYLPQQLMQVKWGIDGVNKDGTMSSNLPTNSGTYNATAYSTDFSVFSPQLTNSAPSQVGAGQTSWYGDKAGSAAIIGAGKIYITDNYATGTQHATGSIGDETTGNALWGNFNQNGIRDYSAFKTAVAADLALVDEFGSAGTDLSMTLGTGSGPHAATDRDAAGDNASKIEGGATFAMPTSLLNMFGQTGQISGTQVLTSLGVSKGDLIVLGDFNGDGKFDGRDLYAFATQASLADSTSVDTLTNSPTMYQTGILRKNAALSYLQSATSDGSSASNYLRSTARATFFVKTGHSVPTYPGETATLVGAYTDPGSGTVTGNLYTWDSSGANSFNAVDVNHDGMVNLDDAFAVDKFSGQSYSSLANQVSATLNANGTIDPTLSQQVPFNLVNATLVDYGSNDPSVNKIQQGDENVVNSALAGQLKYAWYNGETKVGSLTISASPTIGSTIVVPTGATFTVANGNFNAGGIDPLTDTTSTGVDTTKSLAVTVAPEVGATSATLEYLSATSGGIHTFKLASLSIQPGGTTKLDATTVGNHANRSLLITGGLTLVGSGQLDLGNNDLVVHNGDLGQISNEIETGSASNWTGQGITSSSAGNDPNHLLALAAVSGGSGLFGTFDGQSISSTDVVVKSTYYGDSNLDGLVDGSDYSLIDNGFNQGLTGWLNGDYNYDGHVDGSDYSLIDNSFNNSVVLANPLAQLASQVASPTSEIAVTGTAVPEPTSLGLLGIGAIGLMNRRRRRA